METATLRNSGIKPIGEVPWGTHLCQFYETTDDLIDIVVSYFAEGLRSNEFCMWVTSAPLEVEEAKNALRKAVPNLEHYIEKGQIEIISYTDWYLLGGEFNADRVFQGWVEKEEAALRRGFEGLRLSGNTFWIEKDNWKNFTDYEATVNAVITSRRMIALCSYALEKCSGNDVVDVLRNHIGALVRRDGIWHLVEDVIQRRKAEESLLESEERYRTLVENLGNHFMIFSHALDGTITYVSPGMRTIFGISPEEAIGRRWTDIVEWKPESLPLGKKYVYDLVARGVYESMEMSFRHPDGSERTIFVTPHKIRKKGGVVKYLDGMVEDITERKKAEEALRESEQRFFTLFKSSPVAIVIVQPSDGRILDVNETSENLSGYSREEMIGKTTTELGFINPANYQRVTAQLEQDGIIRNFEVKAYRKNGEERYYSLSISTINVGGKPCLLSGAVDITDLKKAEEERERLLGLEQKARMEAEEAERKYHALFENMRSGAAYGKLLYDKDGKPLDYLYLDVNKTFEKLLGLEKEMVVGKRLTEVFPEVEKDSSDPIGTVGRVARTGEPVKLEAYSQAFKRWYSVSIYSPERDHFVFMFDTITDRKNAEKALVKAKEKYEQLASSITDAFFAFDKTLRYTYWNKACEQLMGIPAEDIVGKGIYDFFPDIEETRRAVAVYREVMKTKEPRIFTSKYPLRGREIIFELHVYPTGKGISVLAKDITEKKKAEEQLERYSEHLEELVEERTRKLQEAERLATIGETAGMVGHDIRNPLQSMVGELYVAREELKSMPESKEKKSMQESLEALEKQVTYINKIVTDLQDYARPLNPSLEQADLQELVSDAVSSVDIPREIQVSIFVEEDFPKLKVDPTYMKRALINLITNAVQAMPKGGKLTIGAVQKSDAAFISIKDTGAGVPEENKPSIFKPLFTTKSKGQGFGLPVCKRLVEAHNGKITFESEVGKGAKFIIELPL